MPRHAFPITTLAALALPLTWSGAGAHEVIAGWPGFPGGAMHPLLVPAHALALIALGLVIGQQGGERRMLPLAALGLGLAVGIFLVTRAIASDRAGDAVLLCAALGGLATAAALHIPLAVIAAFSAATGLAVLFDSVPSLVSMADTLVELAGTAISAALIAALVAFATAKPRHAWQAIGVRVLGSWIAAAVLLVLALRLR